MLFSLPSPSSLQKLPGLARKRDNRRHSTMSLGENVVTETSYQILEALSFTVYRSGEGFTSSVTIIVLKNERFGEVVFYINEN